MNPAVRVVPAPRRLRTPLRTAQGRLERRDGFWIEVDGAGDATGVGEATPLPAFGGESHADAEAALRDLVAAPASREAMIARLAATPVTRFGVDCAFEVRDAHEARAPLAARLADGDVASSVPVSALLRAEAPAALADEAAAAAARGFETAKLKVGSGSLRADRERVAAARDGLGAARALRLDAGGQWDEAEALRRLDALAPQRPAFVEQPVRGVAALARVRRRSPVPVAADEDCGGAAALEALLAADACDVVVLKPAVLGGLRSSAELARGAHGAGLGVVLTSFLDGGIAQLAVLHLAAALGPITGAAGLSSEPLLEDDRGRLPAIERGAIPLPAGAGLGEGVA